MPQRSQKRDKEATLKSKQNENKENNIKHKKAKLNSKLKKRDNKKQNKCKTKKERIKTKKKSKIVRRDLVNLLLYRPDWPYFKQKQKIISKYVGQLTFFNILFSAFEKKIRNKT